MSKQLNSEALEPLLNSSYDFSNEKSFTKLRVSRHTLLSFKTAFIATTFVAAIVMSYVAEGWKMDRDSAKAMRSLNLEVAPLYYGKKTINYYGRLVRRDMQVTCNAVADNGQTVDYSNSGECLNNAELHANCIRVCDSSFSTCGGCAALATDRANQLSIAQANCNYKSSFVCTLASKSGGGYDYAALSTCCLGSRPPGPAACMCEFQQSASALCLLNGACLGTGTCQKSSLTCVGTSTAQPLAVCTVPGSLTCSFSGSTEVDLTCGVAGGTQYYLNTATAKCATSCPAGQVNTVIAGVGTCAACSGTGVATCSSSGAATSCAKVGTVTYSLDTVSGLCVSVCPSGTISLVSGALGFVCQNCAGTGTGTCSGLGAGLALTCTTANSVQYYLQNGNCIVAASCPASSGSISLGLGECNQCLDVGATKCTSSTATGTATVCGVTTAQTYLTTSNTCTPALTCNIAGHSAIYFNSNYICQTCAAHTLSCTGPNANQAASCAYNAVGGSYYLTKTTSTCATSCNGGGTATCSVTAGTCACV